MLEGLENEAREGRKGLCADPKPMPPWKWRLSAVTRSARLVIYAYAIEVRVGASD